MHALASTSVIREPAMDFARMRAASASSSPPAPAPLVCVLPEEILAEIFFTLVIEDWETEDVLSTPGSSHSSLVYHRIPWIISQVCRKWRLSALHLPELWSYIVLRPDQVATTKSGVDRIHLAVSTMLERSQNWSLHLSLKAIGGCMDEVLTFNHWLSVLKLLMDQSMRWKVARFMLSAIFVKHLDTVKDRIDRLEECFIYVREAIDDVHERFDMLNGSQTLRKLDVWNLPLMPTPIPWPSLTHYSGGFFPFTQLKLIQMMPALTHLKISRVSVAVKTPVICNHLVELWIPDHSVVFLDCLILPALEVLRLGRVRRLESITSTIKRSGCSLQTLDITVIDAIPLGEVRSLLEVLPSITTLSVQDKENGAQGMNSYLFNILSPYLPTPALLPKLLNLSVRFSNRPVDPDGLDMNHDQAFKTFVRSRWSRSFPRKGPVAKLKKVRVEVVNDAYSDIRSFLEQIKKEGLETSFSSLPAHGFFGS